VTHMCQNPTARANCWLKSVIIYPMNDRTLVVLMTNGIGANLTYDAERHRGAPDVTDARRAKNGPRLRAHSHGPLT
jgi:hypothetical protein